jgi:nucleotide-binding universal stress UspA family protein
VAVLLDGSSYAAQAIPLAKMICKSANLHLTLLSSVKNYTAALQKQYDDTYREREVYLSQVARDLSSEGIDVEFTIRPGFIADATRELVEERGIDLVITTTRGKSGRKHWGSGGVSRKLVRSCPAPVILVQTSEEPEVEKAPKLDRILVTLDGSIFSERSLPYARALAEMFGSELIIMTVPEVPETENYRAPAGVVETIRNEAVANIQKFLEAVARALREDGIAVRTMVTGSRAVPAIVSQGEEAEVDLIMVTSHGRGGIELLLTGSVAERIVEDSDKMIFMVPICELPVEKMVN